MDGNCDNRNFYNCSGRLVIRFAKISSTKGLYNFALLGGKMVSFFKFCHVDIRKHYG